MLKHDLISGISVACILVPQSLSFAQALVGLPPVYGLYASFIPLFVYSLLGTSRQLAVGPEALVSILTGSAIEEYLNTKNTVPLSSLDNEPLNNSAEIISLACFMAALVGIMTFFLGVFRLGFLDSVLSRSLLRGFINAVALVVIIELSGKLLGIDSTRLSKEPGSPFQGFVELLMNLPFAHLSTLVLSASSFVFIFASKALKSLIPARFSYAKLMPEILVLVVVTTVLSAVFEWDKLGIAVLKQVEGGLRAPKVPSFSIGKINNFLLAAALISVIGYVESIAVSKTYAVKHNYSVSPNRELVAIGLSNVFGSLFGAWPVFGSLGRSVVNDTAGARTQLAGLITSLLILISTFCLLPWLYYLPKAVCAAIIVSSAIRLIELDEIQFIIRLRAWTDLSLLLLTFFSTIFLSIEAGTILSIGFSLLLVVKHSTKPKISILGRTLVFDKTTNTTKEKYRSILEFKHAEQIPSVLIIRFDESLYFGNCSYLKDRLNRGERFGSFEVHPGDEPRESITSGDSDGGCIKHVILDFESCKSIDARLIVYLNSLNISSIQSLIQISNDYKSRGINLYFVKVNPLCLQAIERSGLAAIIHYRIFSKIQQVVETFDLK